MTAALPGAPEEAAVADDPDTRDLLGRLRAGDAAAAVELVRRYEPEVKRAIRVRLTDPRLRRVLDTLDVCQSVMGNFFVRVAAGQFDLDSPQQVLALLVTMARNKVLDHARRQQAGRRDQRRVGHGDDALAAVADDAAGPSRIVAGRELLERVRSLLTEEERDLADQRAQGRDWAAIAADRGGSPEALRKRLARAVDRVARQLGLETGDEP
jgi:RNA polymerase sigma-70 factor (ECF subfamily)